MHSIASKKTTRLWPNCCIQAGLTKLHATLNEQIKVWQYIKVEEVRWSGCREHSRQIVELMVPSPGVVVGWVYG